MEKEIANNLQELMDELSWLDNEDFEYTDAGREFQYCETFSFDEIGMLTDDAGFILKTANGNFQITIKPFERKN